MTGRTRVRVSVDRALAVLIDAAPGWIWRPANLRFVGSHHVHFCYRDGHRTFEIDGREIASGRRDRDSNVDWRD
jgi:hypothetical protein